MRSNSLRRYRTPPPVRSTRWRCVRFIGATFLRSRTTTRAGSKTHSLLRRAGREGPGRAARLCSSELEVEIDAPHARWRIKLYARSRAIGTRGAHLCIGRVRQIVDEERTTNP